MQRILSLAIVLLFGGIVFQPAAAQAPSPLDLVKQAVVAEGGIDALRGIKGLAIKGESRHWEPEESYVAGGEPRATDHSSFTIVWDIATGMARTEWNRAMEFPFATLERDVFSMVHNLSF